MRVTLITTVLNESHSIRPFLDSVLCQTRPPDEFIIVDGGSSDDTVLIVQDVLGKSLVNSRLMILSGANVSEGRNAAINHASGDVIACTDAGCVLHADWLEQIVAPFEAFQDVDIVGGWYEEDTHTWFEAAAAIISIPGLHRVEPSKFLPSARSMAFRRFVWHEVGGFPEWLDTAEDTYFCTACKRRGFRFYFAPNARVKWRPRSCIRSLFKQYFRYATGDAKARLFSGYYGYLIARVTLSVLILGVGAVTESPIGWFLGFGFLTADAVRLVWRERPRVRGLLRCATVIALALVVDLARYLGYLKGALFG